MSQKDDQKMSKTLKFGTVNKISPSQVSPKLSAVSHIEHLEPLQKLQASSAVKELKASQEIKAVAKSSDLGEQASVNTLFDQLILEQTQALNLISTQVRTGILTEAEAEDQLLLLVLTHSMNMPAAIAHSMLSSFKESIREQDELRKGLRSLWLGN